MPKLVEAKRAESSSVSARRKKAYEYSAAEKADLRRLGRGIRSTILQSGRSIEKFAYETGLGKGHLSRLIRGESDIRFCTLRTIARGLGFKDVASFLVAVR